MPRPICARIDTQALLHNYRIAKQHAPSTHAWAVVKANAYGHGLRQAAQALAAHADGFAVADLPEALLLRESGIQQPILLIAGWFTPADLEPVVRARLSAVVHCPEQVDILEAAAPALFTGASAGVKIPVYLKVNTGMNRLGLRPAQVAGMLQRLRSHPAIGEITLMTHFANADAAQGTDQPLALFNEIRATLDWQGKTSLASSAAILGNPPTHGHAVRPGIMLYGSSPFADQPASRFDLKPVMTLQSRIIAVQQLAAGERVSYGGIYTAERPTRIGIVACGYADGYPRHAPTGTPILVGQQRTRTLGRVTMDMLMVDLTDCPQAAPGTPVTLWGEGLPADEVAASAGTISYELFCALALRVPVQVV